MFVIVDGMRDYLNSEKTKKLSADKNLSPKEINDLYLISLLSFWLMYCISNLFFMIMYYGLGYRKKASGKFAFGVRGGF